MVEQEASAVIKSQTKAMTHIPQFFTFTVVEKKWGATVNFGRAMKQALWLL